MTVRNGLAALRERMQKAAERAGRNAGAIELVLVTKNVSAEKIMEAYEAGERRFGENKVQELLKKKGLLPRDIEWHFIGHLQTNKVKSVLPEVSLIHSLDSIRLAEEMEARAASANQRVPVLVQVNTSGEQTKFGAAPAELPQILQAVSGLAHLELKGLMTIGPFTDNEKKIRAAFRSLTSLRDAWKGKGFAGLRMLSMGMSHDFELAIEEGADMIRIGTAVFGERNVKRAA